MFFAPFADCLGALCGQKLLTAKAAKKGRKVREEAPYFCILTSAFCISFFSTSITAIHCPCRCSENTTWPPRILAAAAGGRSRWKPKYRDFSFVHVCQ